MEEVLGSSLFRYFGFPIGSAVLGVLIKYVSKNDQYAKFQKEDLSIGLDLFLTACLVYLIYLSDVAIKILSFRKEIDDLVAQPGYSQSALVDLQREVSQLSDSVSLSGWTLFFMVIVLWGVSTIVRKWGWDSASSMRKGRGIALPMVFGVLALLFVMSEISP